MSAITWRLVPSKEERLQIMRGKIEEKGKSPSYDELETIFRESVHPTSGEFVKPKSEEPLTESQEEYKKFCKDIDGVKEVANESESAEVKIGKCRGETKKLSAAQFKNGLYITEFDLGKAFEIERPFADNTVKITSSDGVYYSLSGRNSCVVSKGGSIPYYSQAQSWGKDSFHNNKARIVLDLRPTVIDGEKFNASKLNNGTPGEDFKFEANINFSFQLGK